MFFSLVAFWLLFAKAFGSRTYTLTWGLPGPGDSSSCTFYITLCAGDRSSGAECTYYYYVTEGINDGDVMQITNPKDIGTIQYVYVINPGNCLDEFCFSTLTVDSKTVTIGAPFTLGCLTDFTGSAGCTYLPINLYASVAPPGGVYSGVTQIVCDWPPLTTFSPTTFTTRTPTGSPTPAPFTLSPTTSPVIANEDMFQYTTYYTYTIDIPSINDSQVPGIVYNAMMAVYADGKINGKVSVSTDTTKIITQTSQGDSVRNLITETFTTNKKKTEATLNTKQAKITITLGDSTQTAGFSTSSGKTKDPLSLTAKVLIIIGAVLVCCVGTYCCYEASNRKADEQKLKAKHIEMQKTEEGQEGQVEVHTTQVKTNSKPDNKSEQILHGPETAGEDTGRERFESAPVSEDSSDENSLYKKEEHVSPADNDANADEQHHTYGLEVEEDHAHAPQRISPVVASRPPPRPLPAARQLPPPPPPPPSEPQSAPSENGLDDGANDMNENLGYGF